MKRLRGGALRASPAISQRLQETEATLARLKIQPAARSAEQLLELVERCRSAMENLERTLAKEPRRARMELAEHVLSDQGARDSG